MSDLPTANNQLRTTQIVQVRTESPTVKTFMFTDRLCSKAKPGQFLMLWIPGIDEIPLSIMDTSNGIVSVTVKAVGDATRHMHTLEAGATIGVRGPFGNSFTESRGRVLLSEAEQEPHPYFSSAKQLASKTDRLSFVEGAKTAKTNFSSSEKSAGIARRKTLSLQQTTAPQAFNAS